MDNNDDDFIAFFFFCIAQSKTLINIIIIIDCVAAFDFDEKPKWLTTQIKMLNLLLFSHENNA